MVEYGYIFNLCHNITEFHEDSGDLWAYVEVVAKEEEKEDPAFQAIEVLRKKYSGRMMIKRMIRADFVHKNMIEMTQMAQTKLKYWKVITLNAHDFMDSRHFLAKGERVVSAVAIGNAFMACIEGEEIK